MKAAKAKVKTPRTVLALPNPEVRMLEDAILVLPIEEDEITPGGMVVPDAAKERPNEGFVIAVGPGRYLETGGQADPNVERGDRVVYGKYDGSSIKLYGTEFTILRARELRMVKL